MNAVGGDRSRTSIRLDAEYTLVEKGKDVERTFANRCELVKEPVVKLSSHLF